MGEAQGKLCLPPYSSYSEEHADVMVSLYYEYLLVNNSWYS